MAYHKFSIRPTSNCNEIEKENVYLKIKIYGFPLLNYNFSLSPHCRNGKMCIFFQLLRDDTAKPSTDVYESQFVGLLPRTSPSHHHNHPLHGRQIPTRRPGSSYPANNMAVNQRREGTRKEAENPSKTPTVTSRFIILFL